jgi:hypothetical protein
MTSAEKTSPNNNTNDSTLANFIWKNADDLWGDFKHVEFGKIILPFTLLRRLECVLEPTRDAVRDTIRAMADKPIDLDMVLSQVTGFPFYNASEYSLATLGGTRTRANLEDYIAKFSSNARVIFGKRSTNPILPRARYAVINCSALRCQGRRASKCSTVVAVGKARSMWRSHRYGSTLLALAVSTSE